jgi:uncharacterized membrane protein YgcG
MMDLKIKAHLIDWFTCIFTNFKGKNSQWRSKCGVHSDYRISNLLACWETFCVFGQSILVSTVYLNQMRIPILVPVAKYLHINYLSKSNMYSEAYSRILMVSSRVSSMSPLSNHSKQSTSSRGGSRASSNSQGGGGSTHESGGESGGDDDDDDDEDEDEEEEAPPPAPSGNKVHPAEQEIFPDNARPTPATEA